MSEVRITSGAGPTSGILFSVNRMGGHVEIRIKEGNYCLANKEELYNLVKAILDETNDSTQ